jgi:hypothetical protein
MVMPEPDATAPPPFFHEASATVRFWVQVDDRLMGASVGQLALHHRFRPEAQGEDPLETYQAFSLDIAQAVRRRVAQGSIEPVMLREFDLRAPAA